MELVYPFVMRKGFTLIELIVATSMLMVITTIALIAFDPFAQFAKANDASRKQSLADVKVALEDYFADQGCYPQTLNFGHNLSTAAKTYMTPLPQDPDCGKGGWCYSYETDGTSCPQWYVIYYQLQKSDGALSINCPLAAQTQCLPQNFIYQEYNACISSEDYDCTYISSHDFTPINEPN